MIVLTPSGQSYVPGTGKYEYPIGATPKNFPQAVEDKMIALNSNLKKVRTFIFLVEDFTGTNILPGFGDADSKDPVREVIIKMNFIPTCETPSYRHTFRRQT